jgi:glycosyltransferase involved in cell wall biosynthesis
MMLTVGFDTSALDSEFKAHAARGIGRYVQELKQYFDSHPHPAVRVAAFDHHSFAPLPMVEGLLGRCPLGKVTLKQQLIYPIKMGLTGRRGFDLLHFPAHMDAPSWSPKQYIVTVLDMIPVVCHDLYRPDRPGWRFHLARWFERRGIKNAALVLAISENTARDVNRILGVPYEKIVVAPLGVDQKFFAAERGGEDEQLRAKYGIAPGRRVLLYVGGIDQRKNCGGLLQVLKRVAARFQDAPPLLVMAGKIQSDRQFPKLEAMIKEHGLDGLVLMPGYVPDEDLIRFYGLSSVFCFMSLYEGFGLPPLEAMAAGLPVVSSDTSAMPEVLGEAAVMVSPHAHDQAADAVCAILENSQLAASLSARGRAQAKKFSWAQTGRRTMEAYSRFAATPV